MKFLCMNSFLPSRANQAGFLIVAALFGLTATPVAATADSPKLSAPDRTILRQGNSDALRKALAEGLPLEARDADGNTPLMLAAAYGDPACVRLLLERGADANATNTLGGTPLLRAASDFEKARLLVEHGADVNWRSGLGNTALMLAARPRDSHRAVELLLSRGADVNATNLWGATALMAAAAGGDPRSVSLLLKHGARVNAQPEASHVGFVLGGGRSALMWAAYHGDIELMKLLVAAGADVNGEGFLGTPLSQATWSGQAEAARFLLERGARADQVDHGVGYSALHWAASSENDDPTLVRLLLKHGADPNLGGGENVDAFLAIPQTPLMLAKRRGETKILAVLKAAGATNETPDDPLPAPSLRRLPDKLDAAAGRAAIAAAIPSLQETSLQSKQVFLNHASKQDCTSCHQQFLPLAAIGQAMKIRVPVDVESERQLVKIISAGEMQRNEADWEVLFHPEPVHTKGYALFGFAGADVPADGFSDGAVHHLSVVQAPDGRWYNNLPRPPIQSGDISATALAIQALQRYPLPGRKAEFARKVDQGRQWLWRAKAFSNEDRVYQLLGLAWAGEPAGRLRKFADALLAQQRPSGGWAQLPALNDDPYATAQALYALRVAARLQISQPAIDRGRRYLLATQLEDGTWYAHRRAFPFQPTMRDNGFPHGRDSWLSAAATSWAVLALGSCEEPQILSSNR